MLELSNVLLGLSVILCSLSVININKRVRALETIKIQQGLISDIYTMISN